MSTEEHDATLTGLQRCVGAGLPTDPDGTAIEIIDFGQDPPLPSPQATQPDRPLVASDTCDPAYPGVCIPLVDFDLDCADIEPRRFPVTGADVHSFDGDDNGIGCERL